MSANTPTFNITELQALIGVFKRTMSDMYKKEISSLHCSLSHLEVLQYIAEKGSPTMKDVAAHLRITPPSVTTIIDSMAEQGLVIRDVMSGDRRTIQVRLTPKAVTLYRTLQKKRTHLLTELLQKLSEEQKHQLSAIISTLVTQ
jgi:DNA-binding MarR family transcriptional regulator